MRKDLARPARWILLLTVLGMLRCDAAAPPGADLDPQWITVDRTAPRMSLDGGPGSLLRNHGWSSTDIELDPATGERVFLSWVVGKEASIRFERPPAPEVDLYLVAKPADRDGSEPQHMTIEAEGRELAAVAMRDGWQELRLPLPAEALHPGSNVLHLGFAWTGEPSGAATPRAAAFRTLAVVPREIDDLRSLPLATLSPETDALELTRGASALFPLPASSRVTLHLGEVSSRCTDCELATDLLGAAGREQPIWSGVADRASHLEIAFETPPAVTRLRMRWRGGRDAAPDRELGVRIALPRGFLDVAPHGRGSEPRLPNVFLYVVDTLRADALTPYGAVRPTPAVEQFSRDAVVYRNARAGSSWTLPAVISMLTGAFVDRHGILTGDEVFLEKRLPSMASILARQGYDTVGLSQSVVAGPRFGVDSGFATFITSNELRGKLLRSQQIRRLFLHGLVHREPSDAPLLAYLHTVDPHAPYRPVGTYRRYAEEQAGRLREDQYMPLTFMTEGRGADPSEVGHLRARYDGEVAHADREFGRFLEMLRHLGLYEESFIVLLGDHGEEFGEHGGFEHGRTIYDELIHIPLIVKYPRARWAGTVVEDQVGIVDLLPTVLSWIGVEPTGSYLDGATLAPDRITARSGEPRLFYSEIDTTGTRGLHAVHERAIELSDLKCIENPGERDQLGRDLPRWRAYDLSDDPGEHNPIAESDPRLEWCRTSFDRWTAVGFRQTGSWTSSDPESLEILRSLGYVR